MGIKSSVQEEASEKKGWKLLCFAVPVEQWVISSLSHHPPPPPPNCSSYYCSAQTSRLWLGERLRDKRKRWDNIALPEEQKRAARVKFFYHCLKLCGSKIDWIDRVLKLKRIYLETSCPLIIQRSFKIAYVDELKTAWISWSFVSCFFFICC